MSFHRLFLCDFMLSACMVNGVIVFINQFTYRDKSISLSRKLSKNYVKCLCRVVYTVVEQNY